MNYKSGSRQKRKLGREGTRQPGAKDSVSVQTGKHSLNHGAIIHKGKVVGAGERHLRGRDGGWGETCLEQVWWAVFGGAGAWKDQMARIRWLDERTINSLLLLTVSPYCIWGDHALVKILLF